MSKPVSIKLLLWIDCTAAFLAGLLLFVLHTKFSLFFGLPVALLLTQAVLNFIYGSLSFYLFRQSSPSIRLIAVLVGANLLYATTSLLLAFYFSSQATVYGLIYLFAEFFLISLLAILEWKTINVYERR